MFKCVFCELFVGHCGAVIGCDWQKSAYDWMRLDVIGMWSTEGSPVVLLLCAGYTGVIILRVRDLTRARGFSELFI